MSDNLTFTYQAEDGYAGGARPQYVSISDSELEDFETLEEAINYVEQAIQEDFEQAVSPGYDADEIKAQIQQAFPNLK